MIGALGAAVGNLTAVGGGLIFIPAAILIYRLDPLVSLRLAFVTQAFGMTSGAVAWAGRGDMPWGALRAALPALTIGSLVSTFVIGPSSGLVKAVFGPTSIAIGLLMLLLLRRADHERELPAGTAPEIFVASLLGGLLTGWVAIGVGEVVAAFLMLRWGVRAEQAIGLGVVLLAANSILLSLLHGLFLGPLPWEIAAFTILGCVFGARAAPFLAARFGSRRLKQIFAAVAIADGLLMLAQTLIR